MLSATQQAAARPR